jgi:hypothetical protein
MVQGSFMSQCDLQAVRDRDANAPIDDVVVRE